MKQIDPTPIDTARYAETQSGVIQFSWVDPGARLRQAIKDADGQLRKFSHRGLPTVVCFLDTTASFYLEPVHVAQAMFGRDTLRFDVSSDPSHEPRFLGMRPGKGATLTGASNRSISAVAVLRRPMGSDLVADLFHNPHARVPIPPAFCAAIVRNQYGDGIDRPDNREPTVLDLMQTAEWQEWLDDPEGKCDREIEKCLREFRAQSTL